MKKTKILVLSSVILTMILSTGCNQKGSANVESNSNSDNTVKSMTTSSQQKVGKYIIADDSVPLKTGKPNEYCFSNLINEVYINPLRSTATYSDADTVNSICNIEELRYIKNQDTYYCIFESKHGEYMYIFFDNDLFTKGMVFSGKKLSFKDFETIEINKTSSDEIVNIDPTIDLNSLYFTFDNNHGEQLFIYDVHNGEPIVGVKEGSTNYSYHLTKEGYVKIKYKTKNGKLIVTKVTKKENKIIQGINSLDWPK